MRSYLDLLQYIIDKGTSHSDRTGVGTTSVFGPQWNHDLRNGFPLLTTKKVHFRSVVYELLWFLRGDTNIKYLNDHGVTIWNEWADKNGDLGPVYGKQWRRWEGSMQHTKKLGDVPPATAFIHPSPNHYYFSAEIDQVAKAIAMVRNNPGSRRNLVSAWNPADVDSMAIPPCHTLWQLYCRDGFLDLKLYCRSIDSFLGLPFNIASYALLLSMLAHVTNNTARNLIVTFGDLHIYNNHREQVAEQLRREPRQLPRLVFKRQVAEIDDFQYENIALDGYDPHPAIKAAVAV